MKKQKPIMMKKFEKEFKTLLNEIIVSVNLSADNEKNEMIKWLQRILLKKGISVIEVITIVDKIDEVYKRVSKNTKRGGLKCGIV